MKGRLARLGQIVAVSSQKYHNKEEMDPLNVTGLGPWTNRAGGFALILTFR